MKSKFILLLVLLANSVFLRAQFAASATDWATPQGGNITSNNLLGYNYIAGAADVTQTNSSQTWSLVDMNGDGKPDLVVTAALQSQGPTQFSATSNPYWEVYLNTGSGFSASATNWSTPQGGNITSNNLLGYNATVGDAAAGQTNSSQTWALVDMNGDGKPDLVVTAALQSQGPTQFSATSNPYWQVYLNTGSGFSTTTTNWPTPQGGNITSNNLLGYNATAGEAAGLTNSSQTWSLADMNGDGKPDLVVTAALQSQGPTQFSATSNPYWQVYLNTGSGFSATANNWPTPQGGNITSNNLLGYNDVSGVASAGITNSSQTWSLTDINGDGKPDLVVTAALQSQGPTQFSATSNPYWQVYLNTGSGFSATATNWPTPQGGNITSNNLLGYNDVAGVASTGLTNSSQTWALVDMNNDGEPDLVVSAALQAQGATEFDATSNPYWQVYMNTGSGFSTAATNWSTPQGGDITNNNLLGYNATGGVAAAGQTNSSQSWAVTDINGDGKPDLIVTAALQSQGATEFSATSNPYWEVYLNDATSAISDNTLTAPCRLYPNPNTGNFTIEFTDDAVRQIEITDIIGGLIMAPAKVATRANLNLGQIAPGIYFLRIVQNGEARSLKFSIVR